MRMQSTIVDRLPEDLTGLLHRLDRGLGSLYGDRYAGIVLYGSYARGEAVEGSDVDLLLLLEGEVKTARELLRSQSVKWPLALDAGYTVSLVPVGKEDYQCSRDPFLWNARIEGLSPF